MTSAQHSGSSIFVATLVAITVIAFSPALQNDFVNWDDDYTLVFNEHFRGLSASNLHWMFTTSYTGHYQPLSWLSFAVDWTLWQLRPYGYHLTNIVLHALTAVLFFFVARRLIGAVCHAVDAVQLSMAGFVAAAVFAVHPLRVESVAWATERRDVLSGLWLMASLICYFKLSDAQNTARYRLWLGMSLGFFTMSLLSKAAGITIPFVLFVLDVYPLGRFASVNHTGRTSMMRQLTGEKMWFLIPAIAVGALALWAQGASGALRSASEHPIGLRVGQAFYGALFYLRATVWPIGLIPLYEQDPHAVAIDWPNVLSAAAVLLISMVFWRLRKRQPAWLAAWVVYLLFLLPVLGLAQSGQQVVADRYSYLSCLSWAVLLAGGWLAAWRTIASRSMAARSALGGVVVAVLCILVGLTRAQTRFWRDSVTLWQTVIHRAPDTGSAHANLAAALNTRGDFVDAHKHAQRALELLPGDRSAHIALARSAFELGDLETAENHYETALRIRPADPLRQLALAVVKERLEKPAEAEALYQEAYQSNPDDPFFAIALADFLAKHGRPEEALPLLKKALRIAPNAALTRLRLSDVLTQLGRMAQAARTLEEGLRLLPGHPVLTAKLAWILATTSDESLRDAPRALELAQSVDVPDRGAIVTVREAHAAALAATGDTKSAAALIERTLADNSLSLSDRARARFLEQLSVYRAGNAFSE